MLLVGGFCQRAKKEILQSGVSERHPDIPSLVAAIPKIHKSETVLVGE